MLSVSTLKKIGLFAGGVLFGTAGVKVLASKDAKKVYTNCTAAALRAKDCHDHAGKCGGYPCGGAADQ